MLRIGLTGGIAAGKSTASARFGELGATVIDHDALARRAVAPGSAALVEIVRAFGDRAVRDGELDRAAVAAIVFHDPSARAQLDEIVHPYVFAMSKAADRQARAQKAQVVVHDIPLLVESGQGSADFDMVVTVAADVERRVARLMESRGMTEADARARIASQASDEQRAAVADAVLDGNGTAEQLRAQVDEFWAMSVPVTA
ncbi:dephospho-CoA kinase [Demequina muriae]|uniref:Dephospho-CoA kinase n=1 Tax=Demequina muriae TaxID=3051664 RepID=A0ABT8GCZ8_9MICO|nr:dephospho-CoA kinase [Demequina sp. EGI L300058]MDN4479308.1 dephospho-CoA kinase [Demequina sp. EGI L300058]